MNWIYLFSIWLFGFLSSITKGEVQLLLWGIEVGVLIGQIIYFIDFMRSNR